MSITAVSPGTSVQDAGRFGAQRYGLVPSGAVDRLALAAANALVGNALFAATIELGPLESVFTAQRRRRARGADRRDRARPISAARPLAVNTLGHASPTARA